MTEPTAKDSTQLSKRAMLVSLCIRRWGTNRKDDETSAEVAKRKGATQTDVGQYNKKLLDRKTPSLKKIATIDGEARNYLYSHTFPWTQDGQRILPVGAFMDVSRELQDIALKREQAVEEFIREYPNLVNKRKLVMGELFNRDDYPDPAALRASFAFQVKFIPLPAADDFRVTISEEERQRLAKEIEEDTKKVCADSKKELMLRVIGEVRHMADRLRMYDEENKKKSPFRDSLVTNLAELADLIPKLNILDDPTLDALAVEIRKQLVIHPADALRASTVLREETAKKADDILKKLGVD